MGSLLASKDTTPSINDPNEFFHLGLPNDGSSELSHLLA
jgi:hypothetical protein